MSKRLCSFLPGVHPSSEALVVISVINQNVISAESDHNGTLTLGMSAYHCTRLDRYTIRSSLIPNSPSADGSCLPITQGEINRVFVERRSTLPNDAKGQGDPSEIRGSINAPKRKGHQVSCVGLGINSLGEGHLLQVREEITLQDGRCGQGSTAAIGDHLSHFIRHGFPFRHSSPLQELQGVQAICSQFLFEGLED